VARFGHSAGKGLFDDNRIRFRRQTERSIRRCLSGFRSSFSKRQRKNFTVISRESGNIKIKKQDNLYVVTAVSEFSGVETGAINKSVYNDKSFSEAKEVVFVHGESSIIGNKAKNIFSKINCKFEFWRAFLSA
jgi:hypothetical protein